MAQRPLTPEQLAESVATVRAAGSISAAARQMGISRATLQHRIRLAPEKPFEAPELPSELPTAEELLVRRSKQFLRKQTARDARALIPITVTCDGPVGIAHLGDPHVDDDGTDIDTLQ